MTGIGEQFVLKTRYQYLDPSGQSRSLPQPPLEIETYKERELIELPGVDSIRIPEAELFQVLAARSSVRSYSTGPLSGEELSLLLWSTQGVKEVIPGSATLRTVPSAGARHAIETYLLVNNVEGFKGGLYWYSALRHGLAALDDSPELSERLVSACLGQRFVTRSAVTFIWTAAVERMTWRYGDRGYRYLFIDAGHVCQNLYLAAEAIACGVCAVAAFSDQEVDELLGLDGKSRFTLYLAAVGKK
jgi:SagB-type dehydrogenase family enzyme